MKLTSSIPRLALALAFLFTALPCRAVIIGNFENLQALIDASDAIVVLQVVGGCDNGPDDNLDTLRTCFIYESLKGSIPPKSKIPLQLMNLEGNPDLLVDSGFSLHSMHLVFLVKNQHLNAPAEYRTLETQGASLRLPPVGKGVAIEGTNTADKIRTIIRNSAMYWGAQQKKQREFLNRMLEEPAWKAVLKTSLEECTAPGVVYTIPFISTMKLHYTVPAEAAKILESHPNVEIVPYLKELRAASDPAAASLVTQWIEISDKGLRGKPAVSVLQSGSKTEEIHVFQYTVPTE